MSNINTEQLVDHTKNIIEVNHVSFAYESELVLQDIILEIHQGDYLGIIGPNGSGKTTLLKIILGLLPCQTGSVKLFGQYLKNFNVWGKIGYVPQGAAGFETNFPATVEEVAAMGKYIKTGWFNHKNAADKNSTEQALKQVNMWQQKNRLIGDLSGGQQQRVFIARALINQPEVIFLDEPTTGVDKETQDNFYKLLRRLNRELGLTLVLISHDVARVTEEAMHIACVNRSLICHVSPEEFLKDSKTANLFGQEVKFISHHSHH